MEKLKVKKDVILDAYRAGTEGQKAMLEKLYGKEIFYDFDWKEVTSYKKACELLGIRPVEILNSSDRPQYMHMANAMQQLLVICEAINAGGGCYDNSGLGYYPAFYPYSKEEIRNMGESACHHRGIHHVLSVTGAVGVECVGVNFACVENHGTLTQLGLGFPICLNSKEKAEFVGNQFFELCCQCYGLTPKMD